MSRSPSIELNRGIWQAVFWIPKIIDGKHTLQRRRISLGIKGPDNRRKALKEMRRIEREVETASALPEGPRITNLAERFIASCAGHLSKRTVSIYRGAASNFVDMWGGLETVDVTTAHVETFKDELRKEYAVATVNMQLRAVKTMFAYALRLGYITRDPAAPVKELKPPPKGFPPYITMDDFSRVESLLRAKQKESKQFSDGYDRQLVVFALAMYAGLRRGEAQYLRWEHVDLDSREIRISITNDFTPKTGKERTVPIMPRLLRILQDRPAAGIYVVSNTDTPVTLTYATTAWMRIRREVDPPISIPYHGLRHSYATWLSSQPGISLKTVKEVLGHSDIKTTMMYAHVQRTDLDHLKELG